MLELKFSKVFQVLGAVLAGVAAPGIGVAADNVSPIVAIQQAQITKLQAELKQTTAQLDRLNRVESLFVPAQGGTYHPVYFPLVGRCDTLNHGRLEISREIHDDETWAGSMSAVIDFNANGCGAGSSYAKLTQYYSTQPFIGDLTPAPTTQGVIVWLMGGRSYTYRLECPGSVRMTPDGSRLVTWTKPDPTHSCANEFWENISTVSSYVNSVQNK
jgi:hypothetical protein